MSGNMMHRIKSSETGNGITANRQNVVLAGAKYDAELKQFNKGLRTMTEVLETLKP
ncbi:hypothetical protein [Candidatus Methylomicrobium oryzae]|uniref:hypothetical protein n=1 Tax=Candidatus Methylomicrobium oryzae TaxID=2802053 RepID=UPI001921458C|nr:hypothetical protein [Methylomicrobium sp. RS1]MBL1265968.1 hypothetical protein [Methylomicrobium sp. RS1]